MKQQFTLIGFDTSGKEFKADSIAMELGTKSVLKLFDTSKIQIHNKTINGRSGISIDLCGCNLNTYTRCNLFRITNGRWTVQANYVYAYDAYIIDSIPLNKSSEVYWSNADTNIIGFDKRSDTLISQYIENICNKTNICRCSQRVLSHQEYMDSLKSHDEYKKTHPLPAGMEF